MENLRRRSVGNVSTNVCAKFRRAPLRTKEALGIDSKNKK